MSYYHYHKNFSDNDFQNFSDEINSIVGKKQISKKENNLLYLINQRLKKYKTVYYKWFNTDLSFSYHNERNFFNFTSFVERYFRQPEYFI